MVCKREEERRPIEVKRRQKEDVTVTIFFSTSFLSPVLRSFPRKTFSKQALRVLFCAVPEVPADLHAQSKKARTLPWRGAVVSPSPP